MNEAEGSAVSLHPPPMHWLRKGRLQILGFAPSEMRMTTEEWCKGKGDGTGGESLLHRNISS
jgi:hypothetical protein